jgi:hypothetical protein
MAGRVNLDKPRHPWRPYSDSYTAHASMRLILHLHQIEKKLRDEIRKEQVKFWSRKEIEAVYGK